MKQAVIRALITHAEDGNEPSQATASFRAHPVACSEYREPSTLMMIPGHLGSPLLTGASRSHRARPGIASSQTDEAKGPGRLCVEERQLTGPGDSLAAGGGPQFPVERPRLRLDGVGGEEHLCGDLWERQVGGQQRQQAQLGGGQG